MADGTLEVVLLDAPVADERVRVALPSGQVRDLRLDPPGRLLVQDLLCDRCRVTLPDRDGAAWARPRSPPSCPWRRPSGPRSRPSSSAIELAWRAPCAPQTLTRAARDFSESGPAFAIEAGLAALHWLARGYGYEVTGADVLNAYTSTMKAAEHAGKVEAVRQRIRDVVAKDTSGLVHSVLGRLGLS